MYFRSFISAIALSIGLLLTPSAYAQCVNNNPPAAWVYTEYRPTGTLIQISTWDADNYNQLAYGVTVYNTSGQIIPTQVPGYGFFSNVKPAGKNWWSALKDSDSCSRFVRWINGPRF